MKKQILSLFIIVLAIGFSAFTTIGHHAKKSQDAFWYKVDPNNDNLVIAEYGFVSRESAESSSGCSGAAALCVEGYSNDLYDVGDNANQATSLIIQHN